MDVHTKIDHNKRVFDMIRLLREKGRLKARELAKLLGLKSTRSISKYKLCIEKLGYEMKTTGGYNGGYELVEERLSKDEIKKIDLFVEDKFLVEKIKRVNDKI